MSVLLENNQWHVFHIFTCEDIDDDKKKITRWLEDMNFIFSWWKQRFTHLLRSFVIKILFSPLEDRIHIFAPPCNIFHIKFQASSSEISVKSNKEIVKNGLEWNEQEKERSSCSYEDQTAVVVKTEASEKKPWDLTAIVDNISLILFPMSYIAFNIFYWLHYSSEQ